MEEDLFTGIKVERFENGNVFRIFPITKGKVHGVVEGFFPYKTEPLKHFEIDVVHGRSHGISKYWYKHQSISLVDTHRDDEMQLEVRFHLKRVVSDIPKYQPLLNKQQWKQICKKNE